MGYRAVVAKAGLDAHERGVHVVSRGLRDAGFEVILLGLRVSADGVAAMAVQEDADVVGISSLAGGHRLFARKLMDALAAEDFRPVVVFGGVIPEPDEPYLRELGVDEIFRAGSLMSDITRRINELCDQRAE